MPCPQAGTLFANFESLLINSTALAVRIEVRTGLLEVDINDTVIIVILLITAEAATRTDCIPLPPVTCNHRPQKQSNIFKLHYTSPYWMGG